MRETHKEDDKDHEEPSNLLGDVDDRVDSYSERFDDSQLKYLSDKCRTS